MTEFTVLLTKEAEAQRQRLRAEAKKAQDSRKKNKKSKSSRQEGLYRQVEKTLSLLSNPRHPGLCTHEYDSIENPFDKNAKVFEAYVQNQTPGAYRVFWCYGRNKGEITVVAITPHP